MNLPPATFPPPNSISSKSKKSNKNAIKSNGIILPMPSKVESQKTTVPKTTTRKEAKDNNIPTSSSSAPFVPDESICDGRCLAERRIHCREMAKWGRQMLTLVGLENVFQRAIGTKHWRRFNRSIKKSIANPSDFIPTEQQNCNWCFSHRIGAIGHEACPTMNETILKGEIVEGDNKMMDDVLLNGNNASSSPRIASSISADSSTSTASSPSSALPFLPPASKLFPSFYFNPSAVGSLQSNGHCSPSIPLLRQSASSTCLSSPPSSKANNVESKASATPSNGPSSLLAESPFARFFSMQQNNQNQAQLSPTTAAAERMAITAAAMQFMSAMATGNGIVGQNGANANHPFLSSLFPSAGLYPPYWPFSTAAMGQHFAALLAQQNNQNGTSTGENAESSINAPTSPTTNSPANSFANFEFHQQLALASWQSQMMAAFGLLGGTLNGTTMANNNFGTPSEDEAVAFLLGQRQQKTPTENGQNDLGKKAMMGGGDEQPLDLSAKSSMKWPKAKERGMKRKIEMDEAPKLINESSESLQQFEEEFDGMEENMLEDGSEAESPKLGTKKTYTQAKLDAADIRLGRLGTRRASCVYGIPRSTLRNKIYKLTEKGSGIAGGGNGENGIKRRRLNAVGKEESQKNEQNLEKAMEMAEDSLKLKAVPEEGNSVIGNEAEMREDEEEGIGQNNQNGQNSSNQNEYLPMTEGSFASTAQKLFKQLSGQIGQFVGQLQQEPKGKMQKMEKFNGNWEKAAQIDGKVSPKSPMELDKNNKEKDSNNNKGHRPKRGQYRKYEKDALDKAVAAVRNGDMSVHRAGSHFGVPHSTLEYKVKERNLLRTKSKKQLLTFNSSGALPIPPRGSSLNVRLPSTINSPNTNSSSTSSPPPYSPTTEEARIVLTKMLNSIVGENKFNN